MLFYLGQLECLWLGAANQYKTYHRQFPVSVGKRYTIAETILQYKITNAGVK